MNESCFVCGINAYREETNDHMDFYSCPVCGRYTIKIDPLKNDIDFDMNHLSSYLKYNGFFHGSDKRYFTNRDKEWCDKWKKEFDNGNHEHGRPVYLSRDDVENWYPKTFSEKIDKILLYLNGCIKHVGDEIEITKEELYSVFFVDRYDGEKRRAEDKKFNQLQYMLNYLKQRNYVNSDLTNCMMGNSDKVTICLLPEGYTRIDQLQKNISNGKNVLVAMEFSDETSLLREKIRSGIQKAGYIAIFIDEVQHNELITPELLKYIKNSKFVVVDLTHKNNGAYFEEGYAMGLGKPVIQLCRKGVNLHFDIAQKNTIIWEKEDDIPERLKNRILATID